MIKRALGIAALTLLGACSNSDNDELVVCTDQSVAGLAIAVIDAVNLVTLVPEATAFISDGDYAEEIIYEGDDPANGVLLGAYERPGTYTVEVQVDGYQTLVMEDVEVTSDVCHVETVELTAEMEFEV